MGYLLQSCKAEAAVSVSNSQSQKNENNTSRRKKMKEFSYRDLEEATNGFSEQKLLGKGSHGLVYKAVLPGHRVVAVKKPTVHSNSNNSEVENEIQILSKIHSPSLVNLLGFTTTSSSLLVVYEFMSNGTLYDVLHPCVNNKNNKNVNWGRRIRLALQTAKAIDTLHSSCPPVIHRDIKSANVLIDRSFNARLGDFGLALRCCYSSSSAPPPAGTMGYLDPAYVTPDNLSTKTDVFSFGILLLEIISGRKAIDVNYSPPSIVDWAIPLIRKGKLLGVYDPRIDPPKDTAVAKQLALLAAKCVRSCRDRRPSMREVVECLGRLSKSVPLHSSPWNAATFANPCMMVETRPLVVQAPKPTTTTTNEVEVEEEPIKIEFARTSTSRRRVYSDFTTSKNNLLMDKGSPPDGRISRHRPRSRSGSSSRFQKESVGGGGRAHDYGSRLRSSSDKWTENNDSVVVSSKGNYPIAQWS